jgi:type III secretory pathway component EscV
VFCIERIKIAWRGKSESRKDKKNSLVSNASKQLLEEKLILVARGKHNGFPLFFPLYSLHLLSFALVIWVKLKKKEEKSEESSSKKKKSSSKTANNDIVLKKKEEENIREVRGSATLVRLFFHLVKREDKSKESSSKYCK